MFAAAVPAVDIERRAPRVERAPSPEASARCAAIVRVTSTSTRLPRVQVGSPLDLGLVSAMPCLCAPSYRSVQGNAHRRHVHDTREQLLGRNGPRARGGGHGHDEHHRRAHHLQGKASATGAGRITLRWQSRRSSSTRWPHAGWPKLNQDGRDAGRRS